MGGAGWEPSSLCIRRLDLNNSSKARNRACKLRSRSSNIIHHPEGRSELRDALTSLRGF